MVDTQSTYKKTLESWIDKCRNIRLPYVLIQPVIGELDTLMSQLYKLCINGKIQDLQKEEFLNSIRNYGADFKQFYGAQLPVFKKVCSFYLSGLTDSDIDSIFLKVHTNSLQRIRPSMNRHLTIWLIIIKNKTLALRNSNLCGKKRQEQHLHWFGQGSI